MSTFLLWKGVARNNAAAALADVLVTTHVGGARCDLELKYGFQAALMLLLILLRPLLLLICCAH